MILGPSAALALPDVVGAHPDALVLVVAHSSTPISGGPTSSRKLDARRQAARWPVFHDLGPATNICGRGLAQRLLDLGCPPWAFPPEPWAAPQGRPFLRSAVRCRARSLLDRL